MTGTAMTESTEFMKIYGLDVVAIPTNKILERIEHPDLIYLTEKDKYKALADEVERAHKWDVINLKDGSELWGKLDGETDQNVSIIIKGESMLKTFHVKRLIQSIALVVLY